jgi:hypothetical protein
MTKLTGSLGVRNEIKVEIIGTGARGKEGKSAYEIWLDLGNEGTEQEFIASLKGDKGDKGDTGEPGSSFLPVASSDVLGGIMVGENLTIDNDGVLSIDTSALRAYVDEIILGGAS